MPSLSPYRAAAAPPPSPSPVLASSGRARLWHADVLPGFRGQRAGGHESPGYLWGSLGNREHRGSLGNALGLVDLDLGHEKGGGSQAVVMKQGYAK
jgi:hypothetical protein